jgi:RNA polymerase primary sigma factor
MKMRNKNFGAGVVNVMGARRYDIERYLRDIRHYEGLTEQDEVELATKVKNGDRKAEEKMVKANLRLVVSLANCYGTMMPLEDMVQNGNIGLIMAVREFDPTKGYRFAAFAPTIIRKYIVMGIMNDSRVVRRPVVNQGEYLNNSESLDESAHNDDDCDATKADMLIGDIWVDDTLDSLATDLARVMKKVLNDRAIDIVCKVMGIGCQPMFTDTIGKELGISGERVRQIYQDSLRALHNDAKAAKLLANYRD